MAATVPAAVGALAPRGSFQPPSASEEEELLKAWQTQDVQRSSVRIMGMPAYPVGIQDMRRDDTALAFLERLIERTEYLLDDGQLGECVGLCSIVVTGAAGRPLRLSH